MRLSAIVVTALLCCSCFSWAQDRQNKFIHVEAGADAVFGTLRDHDYIRGEMADYSGEGVSADLSGYAVSTYIGTALEFRSPNDKFSYAAGLRYKRINGTLGRPFLSASSEYFYVIGDQSGTTTEYFRVNEIFQKSDYLGLTADVRMFPFGRHLFTVYFKGGLEFDYLVKTKTEASFVNKEMEQFNDQVTRQIKSPGDVTAILHTATGVEIGRNIKFPFRIETGPSVFLTRNASGFIRTRGTFTFTMAVQIPF